MFELKQEPMKTNWQVLHDQPASHRGSPHPPPQWALSLEVTAIPQYTKKQEQFQVGSIAQNVVRQGLI